MIGKTIALLAALAFVVWIVAARRRMLRSPEYADCGKGAAVGNALQELDRLVARPSIEYKIQAEHPVRQVQDDGGGPP